MGPCIYQYEDNRCRNEDIIFDDTFCAIVSEFTESNFDQDSVLVEVKNLAPTNVMTKFHEDLTKTKTLRVHLRSLVRGQAIPYKFTQSCHSLIMHLLIRLQDA
ncbi:hypothetical protein DPMN_003328 [Dreissena polymorpha]|uniref:Uncharacterized protein n=1 Tax=Dreissena polymorpha TaxID=45954 RepID=A0A9D4MLC7_DREPO|nr:hypothetical protein DPMN_003328 [Dreissena polymorpha]